MFWYGNGMNGWGYGLMAFSSIVFWVLVITAIVLLARHFTRAGGGQGTGEHPQGNPPPYRPPPERLLAERFARGEMGDEEYRRRLRTLREGLGADGAQHR